MADIQAPGAFILSAIESPATGMEASSGSILTAFNFPTEFIRAPGVEISFAVGASNDMLASSANVLIAARGRMANPRLRAWPFKLDGHKFYVLRLGDSATLVYDIYSKQWMDWADFEKNFWRANVGMNWLGASALGDEYGSNVVIGDDTFGLLWFLDPEQPYDQHPDYLAPVQERYFERIVMGQVAVRGRNVVPCYVAFLTTDMGQPAYIGAGVTLYTSDDAGKTFDDHGLVTVTLDESQPELQWESLGQFGAPGRLFKIVDDGAIARIDGLEMNDDAG